MIDDSHLLRNYAETHSEAAFAELVQRHIDQVYSLALRQLGGDRQLAEDAVQTVFTSLARKAAILAQRPVLGGWLYRTTHYTAADIVRAERRRRAREESAHFMEQNADSETPVDWEKLRPVLNETMSELGDRDRDAVWLRFFEGRSFSEVGYRLRLTENAARMRVDRALAKLHSALARRGVTSTTAALAAILANQTIVAAPAGLASTVTGTAVTGAAAATGGWLATTFMSLTHLQIGIAGAVLVTGTSGFAFLHQTNSNLRAEIGALRQDNQQISVLQKENQRLTSSAVEAENLRNDDAELSRLKDEVSALKQKLQTASVPAQPSQSSAQAAAKGEASSKTLMDAKDRAPIPKAQAAAVYPEALKAAGISGQVRVAFIVDKNGAVHDVVATQSSHPEFEAAAVAAVSQWTFDAGQKGGRQVNTRMEVPITFDPTNGGAPAASPLPAASEPHNWF